jgi:RNA polymerase subunit RPABC4/transcription elongation factor Spt4
MTGTNETTHDPEGDVVRCWYCDRWMAASLASCPHCATARVTREDWHGAVNTVVEAVNAKPTTQWLYRVLEQDDDGDPLDFGAVTAASLPEAQELVAAHLRDILGDDVWSELPVRFYPVTGTTGVWACDNPYIDSDLDLTR